jgi:hypothetical protein
MVDVTDLPDEQSAPEETPEATRSLVDLTIDPAEMLRVRDELRARLLRHHYALLMLARIQQKRGYREVARRLAARAQETAVMVWCLDNPMETLTWARGEAPEPE